MRATLRIFVMFSFMLAGCQTRADNSTCFFRRTNWWERRMDRLETWDRHHGYPLEVAKQAMCVGLVLSGSVAVVAGYILLNSHSHVPAPVDEGFNLFDF